MRDGLRQLHWVLMVLLAVVLAGCGGGSSGDGAPTTSPNAQTLSGVAATGAGVVGIVTLKDIPTGQMQATHTDDGRYTFNVTGLKGPFLLRVQSDDYQTTLYGVALKTGNTTRGHINPLSRLVVARLAVGRSGSTPDLGVLFDAPTELAALTGTELAAAIDWVLSRISPYFSSRLLVHGVDIGTLDPLRDSFVVGRGLDLAFDDVRFFYDEARGEAWEKSVASGAIVGSLKFLSANAEPGVLAIGASGDFLAPGTSQQLMATLSGVGFSPVALGRSVAWELSDASLAEVDERGVITAKPFTGRQLLTVTAHYRSGDMHLQDSLVLTLRELPPLASVDMGHLPASFDPMGSYPLYTTLHVEESAGGGSLFAFNGTWSLVDPDADTLAAVSIVSAEGVSYLRVEKPARDLTVRLRAVQMLDGVETVTERVVMLPRFVQMPVKLYMSCPSSLEYEQSLPCTAFVVYNDGVTDAVAPTLEISGDGAAQVVVTGNMLTSAWDSRTEQSSITVTGHYGDLATASPITIYLSPRKTRISSIELLGVSELAEGTTANYRVWATWDDGTVTDITGTYSARYTTSDDSIATFYSYGELRARYILDQSDDKDVTITAAFCRLAGYSYEYCPAGEYVSTSTVVAVRYAPPVLTGLSLDVGVLASGFLAEQDTHSLSVRAIWNKNLVDGSDYVTEVGDGVNWTSSHPGAVVSGSMLAVGSAGDEPLVLLKASYQDPNDVSNTRSASKVITLYHAPVNPLQRLSVEFNGYGYDRIYLLGGDGLARPLQTAYDYTHTLYYYTKVAAPMQFMSNVAQVVYLYEDSGYLRDDGTVWYPEQVFATTLPEEMQTQIRAQISGGGTYAYVPRRVPGLDSVKTVVPVSLGTSAPGRLAALRQDGSIWMIDSQGSYSGPLTHTLSLFDGIANVVKIAGSGDALYALLPDGTVQSRGLSSAALGREVAWNSNVGVPFGQVLMANGSPLTGIVDITTANDAAFALDNQGIIWVWGNNSGGQLGLGDTQYRTFATPISSVTGFTRLSPGRSAALRSNGSLWQWGSGSFFNYEPQRVADFTLLRDVAGAFAVGEDGRVWWWGRYGSHDAPMTPQPVRPEQSSDGPQLVLP
ncbi:MAG: hypothetical protein Q7T32_12725 [Moraxellaceae bacterium]|nr:hypothetical protein [Moraxellaceae bacterium]